MVNFITFSNDAFSVTMLKILYKSCSTKNGELNGLQNWSYLYIYKDKDIKYIIFYAYLHKNILYL